MDTVSSGIGVKVSTWLGVSLGYRVTRGGKGEAHWTSPSRISLRAMAARHRLMISVETFRKRPVSLSGVL